jgi:CheY-like chemotaxis protein/HPt (histidine-containing phosphotransfer) domain-containing protein
MGGHVAVRSASGVGSEFEVLLPLPLATAPAAPPRGPEPRGSRDAGSRSLPTRRVLVVEDDEVSRTLLQAHLSSLGCTVVSVEDGTAAVEVAAQGFVDLILMDGRLPGLGGVGAIRRLREDHPPRQLPILVVTASVTSDEREAYLSAGADGVLAKPYTRDELIAALSDVVERRPAMVAGPWRSEPVADVAALETVVSFDPAALDALASSGYADPGLPRRLLELFWHDTAAQLRDLRVAAGDHDADEVVELAHRLRSSGAAVGAARVAAIAEMLERQARAGDLDGDAAELVGALSAAFEQARDAGARYLAVRTGR